MIIGPYINGAAIVSGAIFGAVVGGRIPTRLRENLTMTFGLCSMGLGVILTAKVANLPVMVLAILVGTIIGEIIFGAVLDN